jgi:hypothetical protein
MTREDVQNAWEKIWDIGLSYYERLTKDQKIWFNIEPLTTDGIIDHYINFGAEHNKDTIDALEFLGFPDIAELLLKVNSLFINGNPPADGDKRNEQWDSWSDKNTALLDEVDEKFWDRNEALENALLEHINRTKIGIS